MRIVYIVVIFLILYIVVCKIYYEKLLRETFYFTSRFKQFEILEINMLNIMDYIPWFDETGNGVNFENGWNPVEVNLLYYPLIKNNKVVDDKFSKMISLLNGVDNIESCGFQVLRSNCKTKTMENEDGTMGYLPLTRTKCSLYVKNKFFLEHKFQFGKMVFFNPGNFYLHNDNKQTILFYVKFNEAVICNLQ